MASTSRVLGRLVGASGEGTRRRIIEAAVRCVAEVGYARAAIRAIAKAAGITSGSLYHYFPNKAELIVASVRYMETVAIPRLAAAAADGAGLTGKVLAILDECESINRDYPHRAALDRAIRAESVEHLQLGDTRAALHSTIVEVVEEGRRQGALTEKVDAQSAAAAIVTLIRGLNEYTTTSPPPGYHGTVQALRALVSGMLFLDQSAPPSRTQEGSARRRRR